MMSDSPLIWRLNVIIVLLCTIIFILLAPYIYSYIRLSGLDLVTVLFLSFIGLILAILVISILAILITLTRGIAQYYR